MSPELARQNTLPGNVSSVAQVRANGQGEHGSDVAFLAGSEPTGFKVFKRRPCSRGERIIR